jgi:hypothetical protein
MRRSPAVLVPSCRLIHLRLRLTEGHYRPSDSQLAVHRVHAGPIDVSTVQTQLGVPVPVRSLRYPPVHAPAHALPTRGDGNLSACTESVTYPARWDCRDQECGASQRNDHEGLQRTATLCHTNAIGPCAVLMHSWVADKSFAWGNASKSCLPCRKVKMKSYQSDDKSR